ncbi:hypothetical protein [Cellulomonas rhizosphaerae]|uniref:Uncharacterized protein n=1 Tax=Cellulomonas rhizosphaerae TaxID=2293719 RepID=A0A413RPE3_9CELL|nr:hypothetical protein [Cellulomonas rhizosphaerae]RHA43784.1 hypothetical protein D1825_04595 [Cellulomonas rhizosphaerae]
MIIPTSRGRRLAPRPVTAGLVGYVRRPLVAPDVPGFRKPAAAKATATAPADLVDVTAVATSMGVPAQVVRMWVTSRPQLLPPITFVDDEPFFTASNPKRSTLS